MPEKTKYIILLKLGEVVLKGLNRSRFEAALVRDVKHRVKKAGNFEVRSAQSTMTVTPLDEAANDAIEKAADICTKVFGVVAVSVAVELPKDMDTLRAFIGGYICSVKGDAKTFKVTGKRSDKKFPLTSPEFSAILGGDILAACPTLKVDVEHPDLDVRVEIRDTAAYVHTSPRKGAGGMPAGSSGRALLLLSGGIDSPAAGYVIAKRGAYVEALHFDSFPYTSERAREKVIEIARKMEETCGRIHLHVISLTEIQEAIRDNCHEEYFTLILRRFMMRLAERTAKVYDCGAVVTGESLGQVASQTMPALRVTNDAVEDLPVFRPFIASDKEDIVVIARRIETFDISIEPYEDCCTVFTPRHPTTNPKLEKIVEDEKKLDVAGLCDRAFASMAHIRLEEDAE